jgi:MoaA/NifB/PqqE/SkfB family radical SAM enzyme
VQYFTWQQKRRLASSLLLKTSPAYVQYYITARCNLACEQCNIIYADAAAGEMDIDQIRKMADNMAAIGVCIVLLIGGEPFVRRDLPDIVEAFTRVGIHVRLQTNGLARRQDIEACVRNGAHDISISLDSLRPPLQDTINGGFQKSWDRAIEAIAIVNDVFPTNGTAFFGTVLMPRNLDDIPGVIQFATEIGWGVSLVPVHTSSPEQPRGFRTFDDPTVVTFRPDQYPAVRRLLDDVKGLRRGGYNVYDSDEYLDDVYRFVTKQPLRWRRRNDDTCDSPNLYFAVAPNGNLKVCCDYELPTAYPTFHPDFPRWYASRAIHQAVYPIAKACDGCMYGSYPEITVSARFLKAIVTRFMYFNVAPPTLKKLTATELKELARDIVRRSTSPATHAAR